MKGAARSSLLSEIPKRIFDQSAETSQELVEGSGYSQPAIQKLVARRIADGQWERVWKKINGRVVPAYRRKKS